MWFNVHRNVNDIRKQIIIFIKKHIIILFTHKSIHNSDRKGIKYRMSYPRWLIFLAVNKQFWSDQSAVWSKWYNAVIRCVPGVCQITTIPLILPIHVRHKSFFPKNLSYSFRITANICFFHFLCYIVKKTKWKSMFQIVSTINKNKKNTFNY